jgi:putative transposase
LAVLCHSPHGYKSSYPQEQLFPDFDAFQLGYGAFTYSRDAIPNLKLYLARQELKHQTITLEEELTYILDKHGLKTVNPPP